MYFKGRAVHISSLVTRDAAISYQKTENRLVTAAQTFTGSHQYGDYRLGTNDWELSSVLTENDSSWWTDVTRESV
jgi:hypothetical protein